MQFVFDFFVSIWDWVVYRAPHLLTGLAVAIFFWMRERLRGEKQLRHKAELETKYLENQVRVERENEDKSDLDIVRDAIDEGRRVDQRRKSD